MVNISIVIPAYNESERLPPYLRAIRGYFAEADPETYEVIVVDDGSRDRMADALGRSFADWHRLTVLRYPSNRGKGAAVREGVLAARGGLVLFADADGATPIEEEGKLRAAIAGGADLAVGSRLVRAPGVPRHRRWHRGLGGLLFARLARSLLPLPVYDTQCGFKMFRRDAAARLFGACREDGYLFDLHVLGLAQRLGYRTAEVPVHWADVPGSRIRLVRDSWRMIAGLPRLRRSIEEAAAEVDRASPVGLTKKPVVE